MSPTNRKRQLRTSRRTPKIFSDQYIEELRARDFLGELTIEEIPVAESLGIYCWDAWAKECRERRI